MCSRLRRGDFWYTTILFKAIYDFNKFAPPAADRMQNAESTQQFFSKRFTITICSRLRRPTAHRMHKSTGSKPFIKALCKNL